MTQVDIKRKSSITEKLNIVVLLLAAVTMLVCYFTTKEDELGEMTTRIEPYSISTVEDGSTEYVFDLRDYDNKYSGIMFYTSHQSVVAYYNESEIYSFTKTDGAWTSTVGSTYNFVEINDEMSEIRIVVTPIYDVVANQSLDFYIGSAYAMYDNLMTDSMPRFFVSLLIVILSLLILVYYGFMHEKQQLGKELFYLGLFALFSGIWSINETDVSSLLIRNKIMDSMVPYFCLMLVVPPFILFFDSYLRINGGRIKNIIVWYSMTQSVVLTVLHFTKIAEFRQTLIAMQILLVVSAVYMVSGMALLIIKRRFERRVEICAIGLSLFLFAIVIDIAQYYKALGDADRAGRYVFLIFVAMLAWDMIKNANDIIEKGRRAEQLEIFALTDSMTGLFNRNAFESHAKREENLVGLSAVVADANGLKKCNDTFGHEAGDEYITIVADIFNDVYGKYGNCYRTGGDEFCCIIPANKHANMERLRKLFLTKIYTANLEGNHSYSIGVAIGDACYDSAKDGDFRSLVKRADANMYENKRACKSS